MKKLFLSLLISLFCITSYSQDRIYLWGFVRNVGNNFDSGWQYAELTKTPDNIYSGSVEIFGTFYVTLVNSINMGNASWEQMFNMFGYVAYDRYNATFYHSYDAWYPMKKLSDNPNAEWIMFNPQSGIYRCYIDLTNPMPLIALIKEDSGINEITVNENKISIFDIYGREASENYKNKIPGIYIINNKKVIIR